MNASPQLHFDSPLDTLIQRYAAGDRIQDIADESGVAVHRLYYEIRRQSRITGRDLKTENTQNRSTGTRTSRIPLDEAQLRAVSRQPDDVLRQIMQLSVRSNARLRQAAARVLELRRQGVLAHPATSDRSRGDALEDEVLARYATGSSVAAVMSEVTYEPSERAELLKLIESYFGASRTQGYLHSERLVRGETLECIGIEVGLTRERVRQLVNLADPEGLWRTRRSDLQEAQERQDRYEMERARQELLSRAHEVLQDRQVVSNVELRDLLDCTMEQVTWLSTQRLPAQMVRKGHNVGRRFEETEIVEALREVASRSESSPLSNLEYQRLRREDQPSAGLVIVSMGWSNALRAAGLPVNSSREVYSNRIEDETLLRSVDSYLTEHPNGSYLGYERWRAQNPGHASGALVRRRFSGWPGVVQMAMEFSESAKEQVEA